MVGINDSIIEKFSSSKGLRQGDPLSPYLFLLCAKGFLTLLNDANHIGLMKGILIGNGGLTINHLFFANDNILFGDATIEGAQRVHSIILEYKLISGQKANFEKSLIYFGSNVQFDIRDQVESVLSVRVGGF